MRTLLTLVLVLVTAISAAESLHFDDPTLRARYQHLTKELRCVVCLNQNIAESNAPLAGEMRDLVAKRIKAGDTNEQIKQIFVDRYGEFALYRPRLSAATIMLWVGPALLLILGLAIAVLLLLRSRKLKQEPPEVDAQRLASLLEESSEEEDKR